MKQRLATILAVFLWVPSITAFAEADGAMTFLRNKHDAVNKVLRRPDNPKRQKQLSVLLDDLLDYDELAKRSLAREWDKRKAAERKEFVSLLRQLVERQYQKNLETTLNYKIRYIGSEPLDIGTRVSTTAKSTKKKRNPSVEIAYNMLPNGSDWRVFDIVTDGVSLVTNYKRQFRRIIRDEGWNGLIGRMQKKLASDDEDF